MADVVKNVKKKKSRRLKRSVRRTLGTLFLVSALVVAAIPTDGLGRDVQAFVDTPSSYTSDLTWTNQKNGTGGYSSAIPLITNTNFADIYTDETGNFQFAWLDTLKGHQNEWYEGGSADPSGAMILRYESGNLPDGTLVIPETVSAFASYATNQGTNDVAVSQNHEVLYYMSREYKVNTHAEDVTDSDGNVTGTRTIYDSYEEPAFDLCNRTTISNWEWKETDAVNHRDKNGRTREQYMNHDFYYRLTTLPADAGITYNVIDIASDTIFYTEDGGKKIYDSSGKTKAESDSAVFKVGNYYFVRVGDVSRGHQWICNQTVKYIGNQYLSPINETDSDTGIIRRFKIAQATPNTISDNGIFAKNTNINNLRMSDEVLGVGNYAFYNTAIQTVTFGNGLVEIGHDAFAESRNLRDVTIPFYSNLATISDRAFANTNIVGFILPYSVKEIYDSAFEGCSALAELRFNAEGQEAQYLPTWDKWGEPVVTLNKLGCSVFRGCTALKEITLPASLGVAKVHLDNFAGCSALEHIKVMSPDTEFTEHDTYKVDSFKEDVCKSPDKDIYFESTGGSKTHDFTKKNGIAFRYTDEDKQYEIIEKVGEVQLTYQAVDSGAIYSFEMSGKLSGKAVEIPSRIGPITVSSIGAGGFANTGNLEKIIIPGTISGIGEGAFKGCGNLRHVIFENAAAVTHIGAEAFRTQVSYGTGTGVTVSNPSLTFTGEIATNGGAGNVTVPFAYAMKQGDYAQGNNEISNDSQAHTNITYYSGWPALLEVKYNRDTGKSVLTDYPTVNDLKSNKYTEKDTSYNTEYKYPFMEGDYVEAIKETLNTYYHFNDGSDNTSPDASGYAEALNNRLTNIVLPYGVESIEPNLFVEKEKNEVGGPNTADIKPAKSLTAYGLYEVEDGAFKGFTNLTKVNLADSTTKVGSYAFDGCTKLKDATLPMTLVEMGLRPFKGCDNLTTLSFGGSPRFTVNKDIIYETDDNGNKMVVECLERRETSVTKDELAGIKSLYREAFAGSKVRGVDLSSSYIEDVPEYAFAYTTDLFSVELPGTVKELKANAFKNSKITELTVPGKDTQFDEWALGDGINDGTEESKDPTDTSRMLIYCVNESWAKRFADRKNIETSDSFDQTYVVNFYDEDYVTLLEGSPQTVRKGKRPDVVPDLSEVVKDDGRVFKRWDSNPIGADVNNIIADTNFYAVFEKSDPCYVTFWKDMYQTEFFAKEVAVEKGTTLAQLDELGFVPTLKAMEEAVNRDKEFDQWMIVTPLTGDYVFLEDTNVYATYKEKAGYTVTYTARFIGGTDPDEVLYSYKVAAGGVAFRYDPPDREGYQFSTYLEEPGEVTINSDKIFLLLYTKTGLTMHTVTYYDDDQITELMTQPVPEGTDAAPVPNPEKEGWTFKGWIPAANLLNVTKDVEVFASYTAGGNGNGNGQNGGTAVTHTVTFYDHDGKVIESLTQKVLDGENAVVPAGPPREGYIFMEWQPGEKLLNITEDVYVTAIYKDENGQNSGDVNTHTVTFYDHDGKVYKTQKVIDGEDAVEPIPPSREGYTFTGWRPAEKLLKVTEDVYVLATYEKVSGSSGNETASGNTASGNSSKTYILTVQNGSGSGSYPAGSQPVIIANNPSTGYEFSHWTIAPENTSIASTALSASVITMPAGNVTVTAHYKVKTGSSGSTGTGNTSNTNYIRPNGTTGTVTNGGTTVVIDKNGLSNTGVVSAVVNGSSDNFTIKISESSTATESILRALIAEYGNDLSNIKYFPMDISLYDSTGNTKITDTTGLRISITLPLPDSLIPYAGNNKVAGVVNDRLDKLSPRFTTIDGVSCVTFTAEHFSPYVIYVDISRLSDGTVADSTPKTGDGIHPKWFLSIGLACLSFVMFMQKDNKKKQKVKAKVKART